MLRIPFRESVLLATVGVAACAPARVAAPPAPPAPPVPLVRPEAPVNPRLPAMPSATGPLDIRVVYPRAGEVVASRDSAFIFGSVGNGNTFVTINGHPSPVWPNGAFMAFIPIPPAERPTYEIVAVVDGETAQLSHPVQLPLPPTATPERIDTARVDILAPVQPAAPRFAILGAGPSSISDTDRVVWGRAAPDPGMVRFFLLPGTVVRVAGTVGASTRVALDEAQEMLITSSEVAVQPETFPAPVRTAGPLRVEPGSGWVEVIIPTGSPPPFLVTEDSAARSLQLTLYGTPSAVAGDTAGVAISEMVTDPLFTGVSRSHTPSRSLYTFNLRRRVFGYLPMWRDGAFVLRIRRPPAADASAPLRGLTIAVDPGHPGAPGESPGATGPTGLREPDAVLAVALILRDYLQQRGANVVMTRTGSEPVPLNERPMIARRANAHALVSIHLNAVPDNVNPFRTHGTSTYYWHPHSRRLAQLTQEAMLRNMFLRDLGVLRENFALVRPAWGPLILAEGAFIMMPDQEYALRTPEYQAAYARSILEGLERYFGEVAVGW